MNRATAAEIELETLRQGVEITRALNRLRLKRAAQRVEQLEQGHSPAQTNLPAAAAAPAEATPTAAADPERGAAGDLYRQVHVFPKGRWA